MENAYKSEQMSDGHAHVQRKNEKQNGSQTR